MRIENGDMFPEIAAELDGSPITVAGAVAGSWAAVLFYRGHW